MKVLNIIIEILTSPFTILFRTKAQKNISKRVNPFLVLAISLLIVAIVLFIFHYEELFKL